MRRPHVAVVIVTWNRWADTAACVASVLANGYGPLRVIVVDNGSDSSADEQLVTEQPAVELVRSPVNRGFAAGANLGIALALAGESAYIFTLNNDAVIDQGCLAALVASAESVPERAMVGPKLLYRDRPEQIWFAGADRGHLSLSTFGRGRGMRDGPAFDVARPVTYLCAGAMLVRRELFERLGGFDPGYFMYYEDCELCLRARAAGYTLWYEPAARVWHTVAASSGGEGSARELYFRTVSVVRFIQRNSSSIHRIVLLALRIGMVLLQTAHACARGRQAHGRALMRGLYHGLLGRSGAEGACVSF